MNTMDIDKINELISLKEFETAKSELEKLLETEPNNIEALKLLGLCNVNLGFFNEGKNNFETVVKYKNNDATSWYYLGNCYDNLDDYLHAKTAYLEVIKLRENYIDAYKNLGIIYMQEKDYPKAFELAKKILETVLDDYSFYYLAGTALLAMKDFTNCIPYFEKALELNPTHSQLYNNLGTAYLTTGNYQKALNHYIKASEMNPKNPLTYYNIGSILQIQNKHMQACEYFQKAYSIENSEQFLTVLALSEFRAERYDSAIQHYKMLVAQHPEKHNFQYNLACCYEKIQEHTYAIGILEHLVVLNPKSKIMAQKLANLYLVTEQPQKAKAIYENIISKGIVSEEIYYEYAMICTQTQDTDTAEKILKKVIDLNPNSFMPRKDLGVIYLKKRLFDYAREEFETAYKLAPDNIDIIFEYANFLFATAEFAKAEEIFEIALSKDGENPNVLTFAALNLIAMNKSLDKALKLIEKALKKVPDNNFILFTAGKINYSLKNFDAAQVQLIKAWEINPTPEVENLLALNYYEQGEYEKAKNIFKTLLDANPLNTNLLLSSAKCYDKLSEAKNAKSQLRKALKIFPELEEAKEMLKTLKTK